LNSFNISNIAISHCTGINKLQIIKENIASNVSYFGTGDTILIQ